MQAGCNPAPHDPRNRRFRLAVAFRLEGVQSDQLALHGKIAVIHGQVAGDAVVIELEGDAVDRHFLALFAFRLEIGDGHRPVVLLARRARGPFGVIGFGSAFLPMTTVVVRT